MLKVGGFGVGIRIEAHGLRAVVGLWWHGSFRGRFVRLPIVMRADGWRYAVRTLGWRRAILARGFVRA